MKEALIVIASTFPRWKQDSVPTFVKDFADALSDDFEITVVAPHYGGALKREKMDALNVRRFRYAYPVRAENIVYEGHAAQKANARPLYLIKLLSYVVACFWTTLIATKGKRTIINAHWIIPQGFVAILVGYLTGSRTVMTVHGGDVFTLNGKYMLMVKRWILRHADEVIVNSTATRNACKKIFPDRVYTVIPMGIHTYQKKLRKSKSSRTHLLFVGRLSVEKGAIYVCEAMEILKKIRDANFHLSIVGDGPELRTIQEFIIEHHLEKIVSLEGWLQKNELRHRYRDADVFIGPSLETPNGWKEALGLTFAEASYAGLPVIATKTGGIPDVVKDGITGLLVQQKSAQDIARAVRYLFDHPEIAKAMGIAGHKHVADNFTWESVASRYKSVFRKYL